MFNFFKNKIILKIIIIVLFFGFFSTNKAEALIYFDPNQTLIEGWKAWQNRGEIVRDAFNQTFPASSWGCKISDAPCWLNEVFFSVFVQGAGLILQIVGLLFDAIIKYTIYEMTLKLYPDGQDLIIGDIWKVFRDLANISLIFILLYAGIQTIIHGFNSGAKKTVGIVVMVAILINFSLLFTKLAVDVSNKFSVEIYNAVNSSLSLNQSNLKEGLATYYMQKLGLHSLFNLPPDQQVKKGNFAKTNPGAMFLQSLISIIVMVILSIILLLISLTFFARFLIIIFLLIFSSLAFASHLLPTLKKKVWDPWFGTLLGQLMFPPVFLLLLLVSAFVTNRMLVALEKNTAAGWAGLFSGDINSVVAAITGVVFSYLIAVGFLVMSFILSISVAAKGGGYSGMISSKIGGGVAKAVSFAGRNSLGWYAKKQSDKIGDPKTAGQAVLKRFYDRTANASFDPRKATAGKAGRMLGVSQLMERSGFTKAAQSTAGEGLDPKKFSFAVKDKERKERNNTLRNQISDEKIPEGKKNAGKTYREVYESEMGITRNIFRAATAGAWVSSAERTIPAKIKTLKEKIAELEKERDKKRQEEVSEIEKSAEYALASDKITTNEAEIKAQQALMNEARKAGRGSEADKARDKILELTKEIRENKIKQNELKVVLEKGGTGRVESEKKEKEIEKKKEELEKEKAKLKNS